jgi:hypothetical protein
MLEGELEMAICRSYGSLLPALAAEGYELVACQPVLLGRRLDLLLRRRSDGRHCIIELKSGAPPMPGVRVQILDYAKCWRLSYPDEPPPRLIVIGTSLPERTRQELSDHGIESQAITVKQVLDALIQANPCETVSKGLQLEPDDTARVRHLLSDFEAVMIPEGMVLGPPWDNRKVCLALAKRGETHKDLWKKDLCVQLYPQRPGCAVLYWPTTKYADAPLHLNPRRSSWQPSVFESIAPYVKFARSDRKGRGRENSNFDHYRVTDWDGIAQALGL